MRMRKCFLAALLLLTGVVAAHAQPGDPIAGESTFAADCSRCHRTPDRILRKIDGDTDEEKGAWLDVFLDDHHLQDIGGKDDLIAYLVGL